MGKPLGFNINRFTGEITTADYNVDPDPITRIKPDQDIELTIRVKDSKGTDVDRRYSDTVKLNLHIRDVNDNRPYFTKTGFSWSVRECDGLGNELGSMGKPKYLIKDNDLGERGESALTNCVPTDNGEIAVSADCKVTMFLLNRYTFLYILKIFSFQPVLHDWCNKGRGMCYLVCGTVHIKEPLLLIDKSSLCGGSGFPLLPSEWSFTIRPTPYNRK